MSLNPYISENDDDIEVLGDGRGDGVCGNMASGVHTCSDGVWAWSTGQDYPLRCEPLYTGIDVDFNSPRFRLYFARVLVNEEAWPVRPLPGANDGE